MSKPDRETLERWHNDPKNWKWGIFYVNPEDPRILPPKRIGWMGWTVNFGNRASVWFFIAFLAVLAIALYLIPALFTATTEG